MESNPGIVKRIIPSSGEALPVIGLGTWKGFDVPNPGAYDALRKVLQTLHAAGGSLIDSSPMYGRSETVIGDITSGMGTANSFFYATKVWTTGLQNGIRQMEESLSKMKRTTIDLMQIHNLLDWKTHLPELRRWKAEGKTRYVGITHYTDAMHGELEKLIRAEALDFVQFNYSIQARHAEKTLLATAADHGVATLINRPFGEGQLFTAVKNKSLPPWASEHGIKSWAAYFLSYIISHPSVTCVIPATANPAHAGDNFWAAVGPLPDERLRKKMADYLSEL